MSTVNNSVASLVQHYMMSFHLFRERSSSYGTVLVLDRYMSIRYSAQISMRGVRIARTLSCLYPAHVEERLLRSLFLRHLFAASLPCTFVYPNYYTGENENVIC